MTKFITLKKNEDKRILNGHLWAFSNEIQSINGEPQAGDIIELRDHGGKFIGIGFFNPHSLIAVRVLTRIREEEIDFQFFRKRIAAAFALRKKLYPQSETFRLVHGEADFLPGLIIDKYNDILSIQTLSYGMDKRLTLICDVLESLLHPIAIIERNDSGLRTLEGLPEQQGIIRGTEHRVLFSEYGIKYETDLLEGQKTGFFLDQRENRKAIRRYAKEANVLDCFCNSGGFALNAAYAGAAKVVAVDSSQPAIANAVNNAKLNALTERITFATADVFEFLKSCVEQKQLFDVINLDPPSFTKSKKNVQQARRGYKDLHELALRCLQPGGILATASCSHHIYEEIFLEIINESARAMNREISLLEWRGAAPDHPTLPAMPETKYLKFAVLKAE